jgi:hypothetical protein
MSPFDIGDTVKHTVTGTVGLVNAVYSIEGIEYLDITLEGCIKYHSPSRFWTIVTKVDE